MSMEATATFSNPNNSSEVSWMEGIPPNASVMEAYSDELTKLVEIHAMSPDSLWGVIIRKMQQTDLSSTVAT